MNENQKSETFRQKDSPRRDELSLQLHNRIYRVHIFLFLMALMSINIYQAEAFVLSQPFSSQHCSITGDRRIASPLSPMTSGPLSPLQASATFDNPQSTEDREMSNFEKRMRKIAQRDMRVPRRRNSKVPRNLKQVRTLHEYKDVVGGERNRLVVVRFYAPWCKACKAIAPSFYRLASVYENVLFVDVPVTPENANLHQGLEVPSLPFAHIYHPESGLVEEMKLSRKYFSAFAKTLKSYVDGGCDVEDHMGPNGSFADSDEPAP